MLRLKLVLQLTENLQNLRAEETQRLLYLRDTKSHVVRAIIQHSVYILITESSQETFICVDRYVDHTNFWKISDWRPTRQKWQRQDG